MNTYTIYYIRYGKTLRYTFIGTPAEKDAEISAMLQTEGVTRAWYN